MDTSEPVPDEGRLGHVVLARGRGEPSRVQPGGQLASKMSTLARRDTAPELALRRELHRRGLRYRLQTKVPGNRRRSIDIAFTRAKVAVFVDGCFWHGCPEHATSPKANSAWWRWKIEGNQARDANTTELLHDAEWSVVRVWEHEDASAAADRVSAALQR